MKNLIIRCVWGVLVFSKNSNLYAQSLDNKGTLYFYWGWNQARYTKSDIRFFGNNYDFTLKKVIAHERQTPFDAKIYFNPALLTIPQCNYHIGYFINDHYDISVGVDHMKYVMKADQIVDIQGHINKTGTKYDGNYTGQPIVLSPDFLQFEHTDGLNYVNLDVNRYDNISDLTHFAIKQVNINLTEGISVAGLYPRTNTTLLNYKRYDEYHLAGYGLGVKLGVNIIFFKYFFFQSDLKGGFINMPDIRTTEFEADRAQQHFFFMQANVLFGLRLHIGK